MKSFNAILLMGLLAMLGACSGGNNLKNYEKSEPKIDFREYFTGPIKAWGLIQDYSGKVTSRFDVEMMGSWEGDSGTLREEFRFYDGEKKLRVWNVKKVAENSFVGTAGDILGTAEGGTSGNAVRWAYTMDLEVDGSVYRITFDDWMFMMNDGVLINRSYLKKFGFTVAELTLFMQKQTPN